MEMEMKSMVEISVEKGVCPNCFLEVIRERKQSFYTNEQIDEICSKLPAGTIPFSYESTWFYCCEEHKDEPLPDTSIEIREAQREPTFLISY